MVGGGGTTRGTHSTPPEVYLTCLQFILICFITGSTCQKAGLALMRWVKPSTATIIPASQGINMGGGGGWSAHAYEIHK